MVEIREITLGELNEVVKICDEQLGHGYLTEENHIGSNYNYGFFVDGELASCCLAAIMGRDEANAQATFSRFDAPALFIHTIATLERFKRRGYATRVTEKIVDRNSTDHAFVTAWESRKGINVERVLVRCGFTKEVELRRYYAGRGESYDCPECGQGNGCSCSAWLFVK